jgi:hypothetical protein
MTPLSTCCPHCVRRSAGRNPESDLVRPVEQRPVNVRPEARTAPQRLPRTLWESAREESRQCAERTSLRCSAIARCWRTPPAVHSPLLALFPLQRARPVRQQQLSPRPPRSSCNVGPQSHARVASTVPICLRATADRKRLGLAEPAASSKGEGALFQEDPQWPHRQKSSRTASSFSIGRRSRLPLRALTRLSGMSRSRGEETAEVVRMISLIRLNLNDEC